jgi:hypothetical protein
MLSAERKFKIKPCEKQMVTVFWDCEGLLLREFLQQKTKNRKKIVRSSKKKLRKAIRQKRRGRLAAGARLLSDGTQPQTSTRTYKTYETQHTSVATQHSVQLLFLQDFPTQTMPAQC